MHIRVYTVCYIHFLNRKYHGSSDRRWHVYIASNSKINFCRVKVPDRISLIAIGDYSSVTENQNKLSTDHCVLIQGIGMF